MNKWFPNDKILSPEQEHKREEELRAVYKGGFGVNALTCLLSDCCFFRETLSEEERIKSNFAKQTLSNMGIWVPGNEEAIVNALLKIPRPQRSE